MLSYASTAGSPHKIVASYSGDTTYEPATATTTVRVTKIRTRLRLDASNPRVTIGEQLTYRATIVADQDQSPHLADRHGDLHRRRRCRHPRVHQRLPSTPRGPTTCAVTATKGTHHIQALYSGDNTYDSSSATLTETVKPSGTK